MATIINSNQYSFSEDAVPRPAPIPVAGNNGPTLAQLTVPEVSLLVDNVNSKQSQGCNTANRLWNQNPPSTKNVTFESDYIQRQALPKQANVTSAAYLIVDPIKEPSCSKLNILPTYTKPSLTAIKSNENTNPISQFVNSSTNNNNSNSDKIIKDLYYELLAQGKSPINYSKEPTLADIYAMLKSNNHPQIQATHKPIDSVHNLLNNFKKATEMNLNKMRRQTVRQLNQINEISQQTHMIVDYILTNSDSLHGNLFNDNASPELSESSDEEEEDDVRIELSNTMIQANHAKKIGKTKKPNCGECFIKNPTMGKEISRKHSVKSHQFNCTLPAQLTNKKTAVLSHNKTISMCPDHCHHTFPNFKKKSKTLNKSSSEAESCSCSESDDERKPIERNKLQKNREKKYNLTKDQHCLCHSQSKNSKQKSSENESSTYDETEQSTAPIKSNHRHCNGKQKSKNVTNFSGQINEHETKQRKTASKCNQNNTKIHLTLDDNCVKRSDVDCSFYGNILGQVNDVLENSPILNCAGGNDSRPPQLESYSNQQRFERQYASSPTDRSLFLETLKQKYFETNRFIDKHVDTNQSPEFSIGTYKYMKKYTLLPNEQNDMQQIDVNNDGSSRRVINGTPNRILMEEESTGYTASAAINRTPIGRSRNVGQRRIIDNN